MDFLAQEFDATKNHILSPFEVRSLTSFADALLLRLNSEYRENGFDIVAGPMFIHIYAFLELIAKAYKSLRASF